MDKPIFVDYESKICSAYLNTVAVTVWDALGQAQTPSEARQFIGAVEEAPNDGGIYLRSNLQWVSALTSLQHNDLGGRSTADAHPISAITGLQSALDAGTSKDASQDAAIALKADKTYVDSENDAQDALISANASAIALKADKTYVDGLDAANVKQTSATGAALMPSGTDAQRDTTQLGALRYSITQDGFEGLTTNGWGSVGGGQMYGKKPVKAVFYNAQVVNEDIDVLADQNGGSFGPITVADGFSISVANGSVYTVV